MKAQDVEPKDECEKAQYVAIGSPLERMVSPFNRNYTEKLRMKYQEAITTNLSAQKPKHQRPFNAGGKNKHYIQDFPISDEE